MGKPVERQNHSFSFFILATLIAVCTAWSFYEEFLGRRPWKEYQSQIFRYEREKAESDLRYFERKLSSGSLKVVVDATKPDQTMTVEEAEKRLAELNQQVAGHRDELRKLDKELTEAKITASDADLKVKLLKSEDDGLFYEFQHAQHQEMLSRNSAHKLASEGKEAEAKAVEKEADHHLEEFKKVTEKREKKHADIAKAEADAVTATNALAEVQKRHEAFVGERDRLATAIEAAKDPVITAKASLAGTLKKHTELTQYWLTSYDNSVDRCQNCHASIDKCGFARPHEVLAALAVDGAKPDEVLTNFCVNPEIADGYKESAAELCPVEFDAQASAHPPKDGKSDTAECLTGTERAQVAELFVNYCGPDSPALKVLGDQALPSACVSKDGWKTIYAYRGQVKAKGGCGIEFKDAGESCLEGAKLDQMTRWFQRSCGDTDKGLATLKKLNKACVSGEDAKALANIKPLLYDLPVWAQTHPHRAEIVGKHPAERFGCTTCHEGQGSQTKGVAGGHFSHGYDDHYWDRPMLDLVAHKKYRPESNGPPPPNQGVPGVWVSHQDHFVEATCAKCHTEDVHLKYADTYTRGRRLVAEVGCWGCHPIDAFRNQPNLGPTLTDLKQKTTPDFLLKWIAYPKSFRPRTKMPNFWPEAVTPDRKVREGSPEHQVREGEVRKIAAYLWKNSEPAHLGEVPVSGSAQRGATLVQQVGCRACHNTVTEDKLCTAEDEAAGKSRGTPEKPGECEVARSLSGSKHRDFGPNLSNIGHKTNEKWLFAWLKDPQSLWPQSRMPNLRLSNQDAADIAAYLMTLKAGEAPAAVSGALFSNEGSAEFVRAAEEGGMLVTKYGCSGCHTIKGHENDAKIGADLNEYGRKTVDLLDFGNAIPNPRHHSWFNWTDLKLRAPRAYKYERVDARMPQFDFKDDEVEAILAFLKSRNSDKVPSSFTAMTEQRTSVARGDQMMEYFNCRGCHLIDGMGGGVRDVYAEDDIFRAPPVLQQQGWRVQPDWLFAFLQDPSSQLRPWLNIRMPTFPLGDERATTLVRSFAARANVAYPYLSVKVQATGKDHDEAKAMVAELGCFKCHTAGKPSPDQDPSSLAPNLELATKRLRPDWVAAWLKNPQSLQEGTRMPSFFTADQMDTVMYPKYFGGSQEKQIQAIAAYVMSLGAPAGAQQMTAAPAKAEPKGRKGGAGRGGAR
jgi:cytochrome c2